MAYCDNWKFALENGQIVACQYNHLSLSFAHPRGCNYEPVSGETLLAIIFAYQKEVNSLMQSKGALIERIQNLEERNNRLLYGDQNG